MSYLPGAYFIYYDDIRCVVLHCLNKHVSLIFSPADHHAARGANAGVALITVTCTAAAAAASTSLLSCCFRWGLEHHEYQMGSGVL